MNFLLSRWCQWADLNRRPQGYESCALTSWATLADTTTNWLFCMVAEVWIEHTTFGLWARRATTALLRDIILGYSSFFHFNRRWASWDSLDYTPRYLLFWCARWLYGKLMRVNTFFHFFDQIMYTHRNFWGWYALFLNIRIEFGK